jgi:hypothetical protein
MSNITIVIVSRKRAKSLNNLLRLLDQSASIIKNKTKVVIGTECGQYKKDYIYKNLNIEKQYFKKNTHPTNIKNIIYSKLNTNIKIFLDDDIEIKKNFLKEIVKLSIKHSNCFIKTVPVSYFSNKKVFIKKVDRVECIGFIEIGKNKFEKLFDLINIAEDSELSNKININKIKIYETNALEVVHKFAINNRSIDRLKKYGIENTIEILRSYGLFSNLFLLQKVIFKCLMSIFLNLDTQVLRSICIKLFFKRIEKIYFFKSDAIIPPYNDYIFNKKFTLLDFFFKKINSKELQKEGALLIRTETYEVYQKFFRDVFSKFKNKKIFYIGPKNDCTKVDLLKIFSKNNIYESSFSNMDNHIKNNCISSNIVLSFQSSKSLFIEFFFKINNFLLLKNIFKIKNIYIYKKKFFYKISKFYYFVITTFLMILSIPVYLLSLIILLLLIFPLKIKVKE